MNVIERDGFRYYLFPDSLDWLAQPIEGRRLVDPKPTQREVDYDFARNPFDHLLFCVTSRCNIVCDYCFRGFDMGDKREIGTDLFKRIADHFLANAKHKPTFQLPVVRCS